ncbi:hypothetical protein B566_EDAN009292 [Ephemera danica]|nr:hypothetical protein B566_EDAN009292 [Ephemera danica]
MGAVQPAVQSLRKYLEVFRGTRENPHASLEPISTDDNLMELDFSAAKKISSANSDYLEMDISSSDKAPTSPIFEEYVDMRKQSKPINLPKKSSNILPLFSSSRTEDRVSPNRGSPSQGSPNRGNSEDYLNMQCGNGRRSQPINIANTQPTTSSSNKSSTSPNLFSLPGFFSRKNSSGTGTPPKVPERSNSPSPFSSLRRRGKKSSKKNKDKRNSMSSDDTSNVTTPVGMFPFSPSTPSKSFVPEEQFAKCSIDASSGGVRLTADETTEDPYVSSQPTELAKRKVSTALRPPILGQSGGKTVVIGQDTLQAPTPLRARSSSSESEYVPMHPSRRKFSDAPGYSESPVLDKSRKCASDNILDSTKSDYALTLNERLSRKDAMDDYAMLAIGAGTLEMKPKVIQAGKPAEKPASDAYSMMQPGVTSLKSMQASDAMMPGIASTPPKIPEQLPANDEYLMMSFSRTPPKSSMLDSRTMLETLTEHVATTNQDGDYAMLSTRTNIEKFSSTPPVTSRLSSTPPVTGRLSSTPPSKLTPPSSSKLSSTPPKLSSTPPTRVSSELPLERKISQPPSHLEDYALMIPGDGRSSPKLLENHHKLESTEVSQVLSLASENSDYALMKPGESIIEYESSFKCVQPIEPDSGEYALLAQNQAALSLVSRLSEDYAMMLPGKVSDDRATKEKENNAEARSLLRPSETRKSPSPSRDSSDDYVLMTPAIKPSLLPTDAPISLHLNKPTSPHNPVVVMPTKATRAEDVHTKSSLLVSTNNVVPDCSSSTLTTTTSTSIVPNSSTIVVPVTSITAIVPSSIAIIPSSTVTKSNPIATKSSSIPLASSKPTQSTPIHIPKTKTTQSSCSKPITSTKISASCLPKPIPSKPIPVTTTRQVSKQQQNKSGNNKNNLSSSAATKSSNNKQPMGQKSKCMNRRSASKSPLPPQPELNYASLDLPQCQETSTAVDDGSGAPALARNLSSDSSGESDVTSIGTTYAQIDFVRTQQAQQQQQPQQQTSKKNNAKQERKS